MSFDKLFALNKHTAGTTAGVENTPFVRFEHFNE